jgi:hypothetical protein
MRGSEFTPLSSLHMQQSIARTAPKGVLNLTGLLSTYFTGNEMIENLY